jgi:outer membrane protein with beta-barrel domain
MKCWKSLGALAAATVAAQGAAAQVGHTPQASPYVDLVYRQDITTFTGYLNTQGDPAGVAPRSGPLAGMRYALHLSGPASFTARVAYARSERTVLDPLEPAATRIVLPAAKVPLLMADAGVALSLTGFKSWNRLVPELNGGAGFVSDFRTQGDVGGFSFGTRFALTLGAGLRYVTGGRFQLRADVTDNLYRISYPDSYYRTASDGTTIVDRDQNTAFWTHNPSVTLGVSYLFRR